MHEYMAALIIIGIIYQLYNLLLNNIIQLNADNNINNPNGNISMGIIINNIYPMNKNIKINI